MPFHVYILASKPHGVLYTGVTNDLGRRMSERHEGRGSQFARKYNVLTLVYAEEFDRALDAIAAEKSIKRWKRDWKIALIEKDNPKWEDISFSIF
jgi:putative endonuclease